MEVNRVPLSQLPSRYGIARSALYTRLKDLQLSPIKQGRKAYVDSQQLKLLDELHEHISQGGTTSEFLKQRESQPREQSSPEDQTELVPLVQDSPEQILPIQPGVLVTVVEAIIKRLVPSTGSRLSHLRELEEAYEKGWLLSTSEVADLLGLSPRTVRDYGQQFEDGGFVFTRAGTRKRGEIAWAIGKKEDLEVPIGSKEIGIKQALSFDFDP